jgi:hypothetical protein
VKVSLRELLLVVTAIAIGLGWFVDHRRLRDTNAQLNAENAELFGRVMPSSGFASFAVPSGSSTKAIYSHASREDRKELLRLLDKSRTDSHAREQRVPSEKP